MRHYQGFGKVGAKARPLIGSDQARWWAPSCTDPAKASQLATRRQFVVAPSDCNPDHRSRVRLGRSTAPLVPVEFHQRRACNRLREQEALAQLAAVLNQERALL